MYLSIIILPLLGSIVSGFFGRKVGVTGSRILSCLTIITTTILAIISFFEVGFNNNPISINLFKWLDSESFNMVWNFQFDSLTVSMLIPVLVISSLVHFYSIGYMSHDPHNQRFFSYLSLFTFMMIILVTGNNYLLMFVGWEGVGVCSYLLVSFWFTRIAANQSSMSAFLTNRVGDCFLTIGMFVILWSLGNLDYSIVFSLAPYINENIITIIGICLLIGAMAKSSQVGLHIWLPMAMEGPTPVSALIHAATMVTAGVYLLIRSSPLIEYSSTVLLICLWLGAITTVFSSLIGLFQQDIKKIIAYSTMSQLGMMVIAIGLSSYNVAIFHLINHAFYKGLLFLGAGAVIHAVVDNQDLRKYGGLISFLPLTYTVILIASLSLVAFPFMTGFFSKDFILESAYGQYHFSSVNVYFIATIGAIFTTLYSVKVLYLTFLANPNGSINYYKNAHEGDIFLSLPLVILAIFSIYFGYLTKDIYIGLGSGFFVDNSIFIHPIHEILIDTEFGVPTIFKLLPFILTVLFSALAILSPEFMPNLVSNFKLSSLGYYIFGFFNQRFLIEFFYNKYIVNTVLDLGGQTTKVLDKGSIEWIGPYGIGIALVNASKTISGIGKGVVTDYALYILIGACFYLSLFTFVSIFFDLANSIILSCLLVLIGVASPNYAEQEKLSKQNGALVGIPTQALNKNSLSSSFFWAWTDTKEILKYATKIILFILKPKILFRLCKFGLKKLIFFIFKPTFLVSIIITLFLGNFFEAQAPVFFQGTDNEDTKVKDNDLVEDSINHQDNNKEINTINTTDYSNASKWYLEKMKNIYEQMMEHEFKWLEDEKEEYKKTQILPENSLHSTIAESRQLDAKEMDALNKALSKFDLESGSHSEENSNEVVGRVATSSSEAHKRPITEETLVEKKPKLEIDESNSFAGLGEPLSQPSTKNENNTINKN